MKYEVLIDERSYQIELERTASGYACKVDGEAFPLDVVTTAPNTLSILHQGRNTKSHARSRASLVHRRDAPSRRRPALPRRSPRSALAAQPPRPFRRRRRPRQNLRSHARQSHSPARLRRRRGRSRPGPPRRRGHEDAKRDPVHQAGQGHKNRGRAKPPPSTPETCSPSSNSPAPAAGAASIAAYPAAQAFCCG